MAEDLSLSQPSGPALGDEVLRPPPIPDHLLRGWLPGAHAVPQHAAPWMVSEIAAALLALREVARELLDDPMRLPEGDPRRDPVKAEGFSHDVACSWGTMHRLRSLLPRSRQHDPSRSLGASGALGPPTGQDVPRVRGRAGPCRRGSRAGERDVRRAPPRGADRVAVAKAQAASGVRWARAVGADSEVALTHPTAPLWTSAAPTEPGEYEVRLLGSTALPMRVERRYGFWMQRPAGAAARRWDRWEPLWFGPFQWRGPLPAREGGAPADASRPSEPARGSQTRSGEDAK